MVTIEKDRLVIQIDCKHENPAQLHRKLILALIEVAWFALENDKEDMIRKEAALLTYELTRNLIVTE